MTVMMMMMMMIITHSSSFIRKRSKKDYLSCKIMAYFKNSEVGRNRSRDWILFNELYTTEKFLASVRD